MTTNNNLPTILTGVSAVTGIVTATYSVWAGFQICKKVAALPEDVDTMEKVKIAVPYLIPVAVGVCVSTGCAIGANIENGKIIAGMGVTVAALSADKKALMDKTKEFLGKDPKTGKVDLEKGEEAYKQIEKSMIEDKAKNMVPAVGVANPDTTITVHDKATGYVFKSSLRKVLEAITEYNSVNEVEPQPIAYFYEQAAIDYVPASIYNDTYIFSSAFYPVFGSELANDMTQVLTLEYSTCEAPMIKPEANRCGGYVY